MIDTTNPLRAATLVVADAAAAAARFERWLAYSVVEEGAIDAGLAASWHAPASAGRRYAVLRPASGTPVHLRLVEGDAVPDFRPLRSHGWAAIELCVQDVHAVHERLQGSPFEIIGPPSAIASLPSIHPMQVRGPDGEIVYLTQVLQGGPGSGLPEARSAIDALFIAVLGCADMEATARWFGQQLGLHIAPPMDIPYRMLAQAYGLPATQRHRITTAEQHGHICLEFDQYPAAAVTRPQAPGQLPPGMAVCTLAHAHLAGPWLSPPVPREGVIYQGRPVGVLRAPEGALVEVILSDPLSRISGRGEPRTPSPASAGEANPELPLPHQRERVGVRAAAWASRRTGDRRQKTPLTPALSR